MKMNDLVAIHKKAMKMDPSDFSIVSDMDEVGDYINEVSAKAKELILERVNEKDLVKAIDCMIVRTSYHMLMEEESTTLIEMLSEGTADKFVHSITMAVIGMLVDEEVL